jgi:hypothetical protein
MYAMHEYIAKLLGHRFKFNRKYLPILVAVLFSILLHILMLYKIGLPSDSLRNGHQNILNVSFTQSNTVNNELPTNSLEAKPVPRKVDHSEINSKSKDHNNLSKPNLSTNTETSPELAPNIVQNDANAKQESQVEQITTQNNIVSANNIPPNNVTMVFNIISLLDNSIIGSGKQRFTYDDGAKTYHIQTNNYEQDDSSIRWNIDVSGHLYRGTLSPTLYFYNGELAEQLMGLSRETNHGELITTKKNNGRMPDGILDRQSLTYQFMFIPPSTDNNQILLTDGAKISQYLIRLVGVELIRSNSFGEIKTTHVLLTNQDNNESIELWLSPNYNYLPLKILYTSARGLKTEQEVQSISFN